MAPNHGSVERQLHFEHQQAWPPTTAYSSVKRQLHFVELIVRKEADAAAQCEQAAAQQAAVAAR